MSVFFFAARFESGWWSEPEAGSAATSTSRLTCWASVIPDGDADGEANVVSKSPNRCQATCRAEETEGFDGGSNWDANFILKSPSRCQAACSAVGLGPSIGEVDRAISGRPGVPRPGEFVRSRSIAVRASFSAEETIAIRRNAAVT